MDKIKQLDNEQFNLNIDMVLDRFDENERDMYEDILEDLWDEAENSINPYAVWKHVSVSAVSNSTINLDDITIDNEYMHKRLDGVTDVYAFLVTIGEELWNKRKCASDPLEQLLFDGIMSACLDEVFAMLAENVADVLPDKSVIYMDNPGNLTGWELKDQKKLLQLLDYSDLNENNLFNTSFTMAGIIYVKGEAEANCTLCPKAECTHRKTNFDRQALVKRLYESIEDR